VIERVPIRHSWLRLDANLWGVCFWGFYACTVFAQRHLAGPNIRHRPTLWKLESIAKNLANVRYIILILLLSTYFVRGVWNCEQGPIWMIECLLSHPCFASSTQHRIVARFQVLVTSRSNIKFTMSMTFSAWRGASRMVI